MPATVSFEDSFPLCELIEYLKYHIFKIEECNLNCTDFTKIDLEEIFALQIFFVGGGRES